MDRKLKRVLLIVGIVILFLIGARNILFSGAYFLARFIASNQYKQDPSQDLKDQVYYKFKDSFRINSKDSKSIKFKLAFAYGPNQPKLEKELTERTTQIRSIVNLIVASKISEEFQSIPSQIDLKEEIQATTNHILSDGQISAVLISDIEIR
ncbi:flagellar basal body-associated FliL family protein [Leptospira johnsonii]|uniref:Flagellar protein FliL n=1 Tax=Leptospira johnsonii TaxID=1917820 RepID=A0A2P2D0J5_9LEPT|nr:flagellar basal body-associated FliL family protein [Leptospira johnsonii]GBF38172.1 flagellar basal body-associated protein FliL [Leptospira johnsonii]